MITQAWQGPLNPDFVDLATRAETPLDIGRSAESVYDYLSDFTRFPEWAHTCLAIEPEGVSAAAVGARFQLREKQDLRWDKRPFTSIADREGQDYTTELELTALEPSTRVAWRTVFRGGPLDGVEGEWQFVLEPVDESITTLRMRVRLGGAPEVTEAFVVDLLQRGYPVDVIQRQVDRAMHNLRTILEGRASPLTSN